MSRRLYGFTLIEVLVAFTITAASLGIIFQIYAKGATAMTLANEYAQASAIAEAKLAGVSADHKILGFQKRGRVDNKYDWEIRIDDYMNENYQIGFTSPPYTLMMFSSRVSWVSRGKIKRVDIQTLKLIKTR